jgi:predicted aspartyl protease
MLRICYRLALGFLLLASAGMAEQHLASPYRDYNIRLTPWRSAGGQQMGTLVPVRVNGGRTLRLLLDTGASGIAIGSRTARSLGLQTVSTTVLVGVDAGKTQAAELAVAERVSIGDLELAECIVRVTPKAPTLGADGIIGMNVFREFRIRMDAGAKELLLEAFAEPPPAESAGGDELLFVRARVNGRDEGVFLVDTGSALTSLASDVQWPQAPSSLRAVALTGATGDVSATRLAPVSLEVGGWRVLEREPVSLDLSHVSRLNGLKVAGILGYSVLSRGPVVIDYRDRRVELGAR